MDKVIKEMNGHSGCEVLLIKKDRGDLIVKKRSPSLIYNERLNRQMLKQKAFKSTYIRVPEIYSYANEKHFYFEMEFLKGEGFNEYIDKHDKNKIFDKLEKIIAFLEASNELREDIQEAVEEKLSRMNIEKKFSFFKDYCLDYDWDKVKKSFCHGDLSFENIIISNEEVCFIDFLDSFVDSRIIDYSKILQDLMLNWSWRGKKRVPYIKLILMFDYLKCRMKQDQWDAATKMLVLNLLRMLPYADIHTKKIIELDLSFMRKEVIK